MIFILTIPLVFAGCGEEIDDMAYVVGIGIDKADFDEYEFTFAIGDPNSINGDGGGDSNVLIIKSATDKSIFSAGDKISAEIGQKINFSHSELLIFSKDAASEGIGEFLDSITRNLSQRPKLIPAVSENAQETLQAVKSDFEGNPEKYLKKLFETKEAFSVDAVESRELLCRTKNINIGTAVPYIGKNMNISSMAVLGGDKLQGEFKDVLAYKLICGKADDVNLYIDGGGILINQRIEPEIIVSADIVPKIYISISLDGSVTHSKGDKEKLYLVAEDMLKRRVCDLLGSVSTDVFGFEKSARKNYLTWQKWKKYNWLEKYKKASFEVNIKINPEKTGLISG